MKSLEMYSHNYEVGREDWTMHDGRRGEGGGNVNQSPAQISFSSPFAYLYILKHMLTKMRIHLCK